MSPFRSYPYTWYGIETALLVLIWDNTKIGVTSGYDIVREIVETYTRLVILERQLRSIPTPSRGTRNEESENDSRFADDSRVLPRNQDNFRRH